MVRNRRKVGGKSTKLRVGKENRAGDKGNERIAGYKELSKKPSRHKRS